MKLIINKLEQEYNFLDDTQIYILENASSLNCSVFPNEFLASVYYSVYITGNSMLQLGRQTFFSVGRQHREYFRQSHKTPINFYQYRLEDNKTLKLGNLTIRAI